MTGHVKRTFRIDADLSRRLDEMARHRRVTRTDIVEAALASLLSPDDAERIEAVLSRRLDRIARQLDRLEWHVELSNEAFALFVRFWLLHNAPLPEEAFRAAQPVGRKRWQDFVDSLSRRMDAGPKLRDELSRDHSPPSAK